MRDRTLKVLVIALTVSTMAMASSKSDEGALRQISDYRGWTRLTPKPISIILPSDGG